MVGTGPRDELVSGSEKAETVRLAGTLSRLAAVGYHPGVGAGRWSYNSDVSWWSTVPPADWGQRTAWVEVVGDTEEAARHAGVACRAYVPGAA